MPSSAEICTFRARLSFKCAGFLPLSSRAPEGASVRGGAVSFLKSVVRRLARARALNFGPAAHHAAGPVVSVGRPSARRGPGLEIQGPQCAFETSMFMCPAVHMSTRNLLRSSSTHEPSDPPFRVVSMFADWHNHRTGPVPLIHVERRPRATTREVTPGRSPRSAGTRASGRSKAFHIVQAQGPKRPSRRAVLSVANRH